MAGADSKNMGMQAAIDVMGYVATVCFALLLAPQVVLNQRRRSTDGLSLLLVLLWHAAALLYLPFLMQHHAPFPLLLQWTVFQVASVILEVQFLAFRPLSAASAPAATTEEDGQGPVADGGGGSGHHRGPASRLALLALALGSSAASALGVVGLYHLFKHSPAWLANAVGSGVCSVLLAVGFLPQLALMCRERSSAGFSLGLSALDLTGSALSIAVLAMAPLAESGAPVDVGGIVPYAVIVGFQLVVVFLALFVYPDPGRFAHCAQWSRERSMKGVVFGGSMKQGGDGRGEQEELAKAAADDAAPTAVEEGKKGTGEGEGERA